MIDPAPTLLRREAEALAAPLPPLLAEARQLAAAVQLGAHGRRRAGVGDEFWQYRLARDFDEARRIDWRRSARSDQHFLRDMEWQATQSVYLWVDAAASMAFTSAESRPEKGRRASVLAQATAILLQQAGERVGLADGLTPPRLGQAQLTQIAVALSGAGPRADSGVPAAAALAPGSRLLMISDFFRAPEAVETAVLAAADRGVGGAMLQVLDPAEESFPYAGRAIFESVGGDVRHETREADGLRGRYLARLAERQDRLDGLARRTGWHWQAHRTDADPRTALMWIHHAIGQARR